MEFHKWCRETSPVPVVPVGAFARLAVPDELHGMAGALLLRSGAIGRDIQDKLAYIGFPLPDRPFRVVQFTLADPDYQALAGRHRHNCQLNVYSALREHLAEELADTDGGILVLLMGYLFGILYTGERDETVTAVCCEAVDYARETMDVRMYATVSSLWSRIEQVETAYNMLQDIEKSRRFYVDTIPPAYVIPDNALDRISDSVQRAIFEQSFFLSAERICGSVRAGDVESAGAHIRRQLREIADNSIGMPYPNALDLTTNRFISLLQYRLAEQDLVDWRYVSQIDFSRELVSTGTLEAYLNASTSIAQRLVDHARQRSEQRHDRLLREIRRYVEDNATDVNMGLTAVARAFHLKPREAAESFRQYFGESINDVLHRARVRRAEELLLTTDRTVQEIATEVGYCSLATMYRAFTKLEGVAPGKFRQTKG